MKRLFVVLSVLVLLGMNLVSVMAQGLISEQEAKNLALEVVSGEVFRVELDTDDGITYFEVYIQTENGIAEVYINAHTGEVLEIDWEDGDDWNQNDTRRIEPRNQVESNTIAPASQEVNEVRPLSREEAQTIALEYAPGRIISTDFSNEGTHGNFFVYVLSGTVLREITIDRSLGHILEVDVYPLVPIGLGIIALVGAGVWGILKYRSLKKET